MPIIETYYPQLKDKIIEEIPNTLEKEFIVSWPVTLTHLYTSYFKENDDGSFTALDPVETEKTKAKFPAFGINDYDNYSSNGGDDHEHVSWIGFCTKCKHKHNGMSWKD